MSSLSLMLMLSWLLSNLMINGLSVVIIVVVKWILSSTCLTIGALPLEVSFLPATKTSDFRFVKTQSRNISLTEIISSCDLLEFLSSPQYTSQTPFYIH
ncbi:hypothetical protein HanIR_Chr06g0285891 [Helianthus annuus]|nr:hypothetical protein HanIR_Chr06g0285891 [Helianthus annuus]